MHQNVLWGNSHHIDTHVMKFSRKRAFYGKIYHSNCFWRRFFTFWCKTCLWVETWFEFQANLLSLYSTFCFPHTVCTQICATQTTVLPFLLPYCCFWGVSLKSAILRSSRAKPLTRRTNALNPKKPIKHVYTKLNQWAWYEKILDNIGRPFAIQILNISLWNDCANAHYESADIYPERSWLKYNAFILIRSTQLLYYCAASCPTK